MNNVDVSKIIDQLKEALGPISQQVMEAYIRQQMVVGVQSLVSAAAALVVMATMGYVSKRLWSWARAGWDGHPGDEDWAFAHFLPIGCLVVTAFAFFFAVGQIENGVAHLVNPTYYAIQDLLSNLPGHGSK